MHTTPLLIFAHRGEARAFFGHYQLTSLPEASDLYHYQGKSEGDSFYLLLTGEGHFNALSATSAALSFLKASNSELKIEAINLGICGALDEHFQVGQALFIRTLYSEGLHQGMEFKSFNTKTIDNKDSSFPFVDLVSSHHRVLEQDKKQKLSAFAPLVDREAWAIGFTCHKQGVPLTVIKLVSDHAEGEICIPVKEEAELWSDKLLRQYLSLKETPSKAQVIVKTIDSLKEKFPDLHITVAQERSLISLFNALSLKNISNEMALKSFEESGVLELDLRPKDKTKKLIEALSHQLSPLSQKLKSALTEVSEPLSLNGFNVRFDQDYEKAIIHLSTTLQNKSDINKLITGLENFSYENFLSLLNGDIDHV